MNPLFIIDGKNTTKKTYADLLSDISKTNEVAGCIYTSNPYRIFLDLIVNLLQEREPLLLDSDFSNAELSGFGIEEAMLRPLPLQKSFSFESPVALRDQLLDNASNLHLTLLSSGTTGKPKKVRQSLKNLLRNIRIADQHKDSQWGFLYNPTHFAGLQVFLHSFMNINTIHYLFNLDPAAIAGYMASNRLTHLSATPTQYRLILPFLKQQIPSVKRVTLGGEKYDEALIPKLKKVFINAKFTNIYASTEAGSLFNSSSGVFEIPPALAGKVKISNSSELLIHTSLLSDSLSGTGEWYATGDVVEKVDESAFRFTARVSEFINVGGYKVNPKEVEDHIKTYEFVNDALVYGKKNSVLGNILIAQVVLRQTSDEQDAKNMLLKGLRENLQPWKIPAKFTFTNSLSIARTGKKKSE